MSDLDIQIPTAFGMLVILLVFSFCSQFSLDLYQEYL
uniref:Uncharacterized protein n=1 Tax=Arundo donax TaxID=35708 RepID=A0A0A9DX86_ARUDO